jgi:hypothetical protein
MAETTTETTWQCYLKHRKRWNAGLLFLVIAIMGIIFTAFGYMLFATWWKNEQPQQRPNDLSMHIAMVIFSCIPVSSIIGVLLAALYYTRKRSKYGKYRKEMRREGKRGYHFDPRDAEDEKKAKAAKIINDVLKAGNADPVTLARAVDTGKKKSKEGTRPRELARMRDQATLSNDTPQPSPLPFPSPTHLPPTSSTHFPPSTHRSSFNPYNWGTPHIHIPYLHPSPNPPRSPDLEKNAAASGIQRSDSIRTSKDDPILKKGVESIWGVGKKDSVRRK